MQQNITLSCLSCLHTRRKNKTQKSLRDTFAICNNLSCSPDKQLHFIFNIFHHQLKAAEAGMTLDRGESMQASTELLLAANGDITPNNHNGTNGSIITMTLKNNHLIVETEERNVSRD